MSIRYAEALDDINRREFAVGIGKLRAIVNRYPWFSLAHLTIAQTEDQRGAWLSAFVAYRRFASSTTLHPGDEATVAARVDDLARKSKPLALFNEAEAMAKERKWPRTITLLRQVLDEKPSFAPAHRLLGDAHAAQGNAAMASAEYKSYLELDADAPDAPEIEKYIDTQTRANRP